MQSDQVALHFLFQREILFFERGDQNEIRGRAGGLFGDFLFYLQAFFCEGIDVSLYGHKTYHLS